ncbi:MAG TPA: Maf family protein [Terracidiphilus sp.]|jgi:septum formation protein|nr:Maf family protein [Terracidiphilus sp.]
MSRLILASASPRRRELLAQAGFVFEVRAAHIPEEPRAGEDPIAYVTRLAREKAEAVFREQGMRSEVPKSEGPGAPSEESVVESNLEHPSPVPKGEGPGAPPERENEKTRDRGTKGTRDQGNEGPGDPLLGGIVVLGADTTVTLDRHILEKPRDAEDAKRMLRMLSGRTHRVITGVAVVSEDRTEVAAEVTAVRFLTLSEEEIAAYVASGEPMDKAGAYGIQGLAAKWIPRIEGCYFNVVGLPLALVGQMLKDRE